MQISFFFHYSSCLWRRPIPPPPLPRPPPSSIFFFSSSTTSIPPPPLPALTRPLGPSGAWVSSGILQIRWPFENRLGGEETPIGSSRVYKGEGFVDIQQTLIPTAAENIFPLSRQAKPHRRFPFLGSSVAETSSVETKLIDAAVSRKGKLALKTCKLALNVVSSRIYWCATVRVKSV